MPVTEAISNNPRHVAIIMDGNGRWAAERGLPRVEGHRRGGDSVKQSLKAARKAGVPFLTLYAFSVENWQRPEKEIESLMGLLLRSLKNNRKFLCEHKIRLRVIGDRSRLPDEVRAEIVRVEDATAAFGDWNLVLALNYGSRDEVLRVCQRLVERAQSGEACPLRNWDDLAQELDTADIPDPDLIIRSSGEHRLSNFLMLQGAYSELYFTPTLWPDFSEEDFMQAVEAYRLRKRRFGGLESAPVNEDEATSGVAGEPSRGGAVL